MEMQGVDSQTGPAHERSDVCTICQESIEPSHPTLIHTSHCKNTFHDSCLKDSLKRDGKCPICKHEISKPVSEEERWEHFLEFFHHRKPRSKKPWQQQQKLIYSPGYLQQFLFFTACKDEKRVAIRQMQDATDVFDRMTADFARLEATNIDLVKYRVEESSRDMQLEISRRRMRGQDRDQVKKYRDEARTVIENDTDTKIQKVLTEMASMREQLASDHIEELEKIDNRMKEMIGFHWWRLQQARDKDSRSAEWVDIPYPV